MTSDTDPDSDFQELLDEMREYVKMTDGTVKQEIGPEIQDGREIRGLRVERANYQYDVLGSPDMDYVLVSFGFNLLENLKGSGIEEPAAFLRRNAEMNRLVLNLMREMSDPSVEVGIETTDEGVLAGFNVETKLFPSDGRFGVAAFEDAARAVVAQGDRGIKYIQLALEIGDPSGDGPEQDPDRGFR